MSRARDLADSADKDIAGTLTLDGLSVSGDVAVDTDTLFVDASADSVGIGTSSPSRPLHLVSVGTTTPMRIDSGTSAASLIDFKDTATTADFKVRVGSTGDDFVTYAGGSERLRIDSSGNLLVGKTSSSTTTAGFEARANGQTVATIDGGTALIANRETSDGDIIKVMKDGTTVGSIGVVADGSYKVLKISSAYPAVGKIKLDNVVETMDTNWASIPQLSPQSDASINLGAAARRFKDLYLSGGVYLGGTGSANHLDDYEEGTFTPVLDGVTGLTQTGIYTKIGNVVYFHILFHSNTGATGTPTYTISGLPFSSRTGERQANVNISRMYNISITTTDYIAGINDTTIYFGYVNGNNAANSFSMSSNNTLRLSVSGTYHMTA